MSGDILTVGAVVALAPFVWRLNASLRHDLNTRMDRLETRLDRMEVRLDGRFDTLAADMASIDKRLTAVETTLDLLVKGLHIEVSGRQAPG